MAIDTCWTLNDLTEIYLLVFSLPTLKYLKCEATPTEISISLPIAIEKQFTAIKKFIIGHSCSFNELCSLISYTPQLNYLNIKDLSENDSINQITLSMPSKSRRF